MLGRRGTVTDVGGGTDVSLDGASALSLDGVSREYRRGVRALDEVSLQLPRGRFLAVMGRSGSGKSTMLACAAGLDRPTGGTVRVGGTDLSGLTPEALTRLRRDRIGFVFQDLNLLPALTVLENVALPLLLAETGGIPAAEERARRALAAVGLPDRADDAPARLSGGQRQRVAVARALVTGAGLLLADEPTGALDPVTAQEVLGLLRHTVDTEGNAVLMVTHDPAAARWADSTVFLTDGRVTGCLERPDEAAIRRELARGPVR
ncbi:ABC transporter ATP-binding protein [Streptomyces sp. NPDC048172]|uniref:ABC transporter ATP-binding protein n=1 Tax=Streptomyces sp. NPDC048172 TaxID=3365505 RepID=UPI003712779F